jgi:hypothetical protein
VSNPLNPDLTLNTLELAFVVYAAEEFHAAPDFPPLDKVTRLVEAISSQYEGAEVSAEDLLNHLFEKYNIQ